MQRAKLAWHVRCCIEPHMLRVAVLSIVAICASLPKVAQADNAQPEDLSQKSNDPSASLMSLKFKTKFASVWQDRTGRQTFEFQPVIPVELWGVANIMRLTIPYQLGGTGPEGMEDLEMFDLATFERDVWRFGLGPLVEFAARESKSAAKIAGGPVLAAVVRVGHSLKLGVLNQNVFGDQKQESKLQPIVAYELGAGWSISAGDLQFTYDWYKGYWTDVPLGLQLGAVYPLASQQVHWSISTQYNLRRIHDATRFQVTLALAFIAPN